MQPGTPHKGLFAHIRANNAKSLALFIWFAVLLQLLQIALFLPFVSLGVSMKHTIIGKNRIEISDSHIPGAKKVAVAPIPEDERPPFYLHLETLKQFARMTGVLEGSSLVIFAPAVLYILLGCWLHSTLIRRQSGARRISRREEPRLANLTETLTISRGLPLPHLEIIESPGCNAYASGFHPRSSTIGVSRGLLVSLNDAELESVLAHEIAHIENHDNRLMTLANLCTSSVTAPGRIFLNGFRNQPYLTTAFVLGSAWLFSWQIAAICYALVFAAYWLGHATKFTISRKREFIADAQAIEMVKQPWALMSALYKIARNDRIGRLDPTLQAMMISNLSGTDRSTHPSVEERITAISATTGVSLQQAVTASLAAPQSQHDATAPGFGQSAGGYGLDKAERRSENVLKWTGRLNTFGAKAFKLAFVALLLTPLWYPILSIVAWEASH